MSQVKRNSLGALNHSKKSWKLFGCRQETVQMLVLDGWCESRLEDLLDRLTIDVP